MRAWLGVIAMAVVACSMTTAPADDDDDGTASTAAATGGTEDVGGSGGTGGSQAVGGAGGSGTTGPVDTWNNFAMAWMDTYCVECHGPNSSRDYSDYDRVKLDADSIRCGVRPLGVGGCGSYPAPNQFPIGQGPRPDDDSRRRMVAWFDAGVPQ
jgi:hypothetical protein